MTVPAAGQSIGASSIAATIELEIAPSTKGGRVNARASTASARSLPPSTCSRPGRWVISAWSVPQLYSLPTSKAPPMRATAAPNSGKPAIMFSTKAWGRIEASMSARDVSPVSAEGER